MAFAIFFLLLVLINTNQVLGKENFNSDRRYTQDNDGSLEEILSSQQNQIDFLVQQVSELSKVSKNQRFEIDDLKKENRNLLFTISDINDLMYLYNINGLYNLIKRLSTTWLKETIKALSEKVCSYKC